MNAHYRITTDDARCLLRIELGGFFEAGDLAALAAEKALAIGRMRCGRNRHVTLCDVSACKIQTSEIAEIFAGMIADPAFQSRRLAIVTGGSIARLQARRLVDRENAACFGDVESAEAWLFASTTAMRAPGDGGRTPPYL